MTSPVVLAHDLILDGVPDGMTLREAMDLLERMVIAGTLARHGGRVKQTAAALGITREGLTLARRRLGLPVKPGGRVARPVPADWRERLTR